MGPRAGRALDRPAHGRGGLRAGRRRAHAATTPSCSTSSATSSSRSTSSRCCSRSAARARWPRSPSTCRQKLIRRHPHVFGDVEVETRRRGAAQLGRDQGDRGRPRAGHLRRGAREPARAALRAQGPAPRGVDRLRLRPRPLRGGARRARRARGGRRTREERFHEVGDVLFAAVNVARKLKVDPELALRAAAERFRGRVEAAEALAASDGQRLERSGARRPARALRAGSAERGDRRLEPDRDASTPARSSTRAATRPSRSSSPCAPAPPAAPPSRRGASTGEFEATELRDGGDAYLGKGVTQGGRQRQRRDRRRRSPAATRSTRPASTAR